jgi:hypothetical protein
VPRGARILKKVEVHTVMRWALSNVGVEEGSIQSHVRKPAAVIAPTLHAAEPESRRVGAAAPL